MIFNSYKKKIIEIRTRTQKLVNYECAKMTFIYYPNETRVETIRYVSFHVVFHVVL